MKPTAYKIGEWERKCLSKDMQEVIWALEQENKTLKEELEKDNREVQVDVNKGLLKANDYLIKENQKLKNAIEYRKRKAESNQEKANQIDKIMNLPWVMVDWKINWSKVAVYYMM